jgi:hypothetical protein
MLVWLHIIKANGLHCFILNPNVASIKGEIFYKFDLEEKKLYVVFGGTSM